jgi:flagellin
MTGVMGIHTNMPAYVAHINMAKAMDNLSITTAQLSSGRSIVEPYLGVSELALGTIQQGEYIAFKTAKTVLVQAQSILGIASGSLQSVKDGLHRLQALVIQAGSDNIGDVQRGLVGTEFQSLKQELGRIIASTTFNGQALFGTGGGSGVNLMFRTGPDVRDLVMASLPDPSAIISTLDNVSFANIADAQAAGTSVNTAINMVLYNIAEVAGVQSKLKFAESNVDVRMKATDALQSAFLDADIAKVSTEHAKNLVALKASISVLAQANDILENFLKLYK